MTTSIDERRFTTECGCNTYPCDHTGCDCDGTFRQPGPDCPGQEDRCREFYAGVRALTCQLPAGHDGNHRHTKRATEWRWNESAGACYALPVAPAARASVIDAAHIERQRAFSERTFGPGERTAGVVAHITKELEEIVDDPHDVVEWADVIILAIDGAWRAGHEPQAILDAIVAKQARNEARTWPDWRTVPEGQPIEHVRGAGDA